MEALSSDCCNWLVVNRAIDCWVLADGDVVEEGKLNALNKNDLPPIELNGLIVMDAM